MDITAIAEAAVYLTAAVITCEAVPILPVVLQNHFRDQVLCQE